MEHITNPFVFNDVVSWLWKRLFCARGLHLFDEILTDTEQSYFECDGCGYRVYIAKARTNVIPAADRLAALEAWVTTFEDRLATIEARLEALERSQHDHVGRLGALEGTRAK